MNKKWYMSKAIWAGCLLIVYGVYCAVSGETEDINVIRTMLEGLGIIGIRAAVP